MPPKFHFKIGQFTLPPQHNFFSCSSSSFTINPSSIPRLKPSHTITSPEEFYRYPIFSFFIFHLHLGNNGTHSPENDVIYAYSENSHFASTGFSFLSIWLNTVIYFNIQVIIFVLFCYWMWALSALLLPFCYSIFNCYRYYRCLKFLQYCVWAKSSTYFFYSFQLTLPLYDC